MEFNWLLAQARRTSRNRLVCAVFIAGATVALLGTQAAYLREYFAGPRALALDQLERITDAERTPRKWVKFEARAIEQTGVNEVTVRTKRGVERGRSVSAHYYAAALGTRAILVKVPADEQPARLLVGELRPLDPGPANALFQGRNAALRDTFLPVELHTENFRERGNWYLVLAAFALLFALAYGLTRAAA